MSITKDFLMSEEEEKPMKKFNNEHAEGFQSMMNKYIKIHLHGASSVEGIVTSHNTISISIDMTSAIRGGKIRPITIPMTSILFYELID